jgi:hypothetical protein
LNPNDTNPQGIADPPTTGVAQVALAPPARPTVRQRPAFSAAAVTGVDLLAAAAALKPKSGFYADWLSGAGDTIE